MARRDEDFVAFVDARSAALLRTALYYDDLSEAQIAAALGCSPGTVKAHASRALTTLRGLAAAPSDLSGVHR